MARKALVALLLTIMMFLLLYCKKEGESAVDTENVKIEKDVLYIDLENISFKGISGILLEAIKSYDADARMARIEISIDIETGIRDLKAVLFNDEDQIRYICNIEDNKLIVRENPALFQAPLITAEDIVVDYQDIIVQVEDIQDPSARELIKAFALSKIIFYSRQERPTYILKYVNRNNQNQSIIAYFDSKTGELYHTEKFGF